LTTMSSVNDFLDLRTLAVVGVSRSEKKFSRRLYRTLKKRGYNVFAVNPNMDSIDGEICYENLQSLPQKADGAVIVVPPDQTNKVVRDAVEAGVKHIWIQQGAESKEAIDYCTENQINVIHDQCVLMFAEPSFPHSFHRSVLKVFGKLPK